MLFSCELFRVVYPVMFGKNTASLLHSGKLEEDLGFAAKQMPPPGVSQDS